MIASTDEVFSDLTAAGLVKATDRFTFAADRDNTRRWLIPGDEGGPLTEVYWDGSDWLIVGTDTPA